MLKARLLLASCLVSALVVVPFGSPAGAQEEPQLDCSFFIGDYLVIPEGWTIWDLYETGEYTWTIRGDIAISVANQVAASLLAEAAEDVACIRSYVEAVAADAASDAVTSAESLLACVTEATGPLLSSDPPTSRYVEVGLDGVVHIHFGAIIEDEFALFDCGVSIL